MTAMDHLRKLVGMDSPYCCSCVYCGNCNAYEGRPHEPFCPWVAAKAFVEAHDKAEAETQARLARIAAIADNPRGFTLLELLVVIVIIVLVSAVALPTILAALRHRQASEGARALQSALVGARDLAIRNNQPSGIRLLPDADLASTASSFLPIATPAAYTDGLVSLYPGTSYPASVLNGTSALVLEESPIDSSGQLTNPTSWFWNIRVGDKIQINNAGPWYTVAGPMATSNPEAFTNVGTPGTKSPWSRQLQTASGPATFNPEFLLLTNGQDDNGNGWIDEGWDGCDNNGDGNIDESAEWEAEVPLGALTNGGTALPYSVRRRPAPTSGARAVMLPSNVVVDLARSVVPQNKILGSIDIVVEPTGRMSPVLIYSQPSSIMMSGSFFQLWLSERSDVGQSQPQGQWYLLTANGRTGAVTVQDQPDLVTGYAKGMRGDGQ